MGQDPDGQVDVILIFLQVEAPGKNRDLLLVLNFRWIPLAAVPFERHLRARCCRYLREIAAGRNGTEPPQSDSPAVGTPKALLYSNSELLWRRGLMCIWQVLPSVCGLFCQEGGNGPSLVV